MVVEYIVGPVLALLLGMKFSDFKSKQADKTIAELNEKIEKLEQHASEVENEMPKKLMATVMPIAKAVNKLNQQVGLWM